MPSGDPNVAVGAFSGSGTNGPLEEVTFGGHPAGWATNVLTWTENSIGYLVGGPEMTLEQACHIAESFD